MKKITLTTLVLLLVNFSSSIAQVQVDKFTGDVNYGLPLLTVPNFKGPSVPVSVSYRSDIKVDQPASEVGLGWDIHAGGSIERTVNGIPDDWVDVNVPDQQAASFQKHLGSLYLNNTDGNSTILDFDYMRYKMDTLNDTIKYYYPNYDSYFVTGAAMSGKIIPENYDFSTVIVDTLGVNRWFYSYRWDSYAGEWKKDSVSLGISERETYSFDMDNPEFQYKTHFRYEYNLHEEVDAKFYDWDDSPISSSTHVYIPEDTTYSGQPTFSGAGYNDETHTDAANRNRSRTSNYIEYFTNDSIEQGLVSNFMEYDTTFDRSVEANFPQDGIGAFRITDGNGITYHYSLPVYAHYNTSGNVNLDKDFEPIINEGGTMEITDSTLGYIVENDVTHEILEIKQIKKYAIRWLLTAITGPDFNDANANGVVDEEDEGYWVKYDYGLWTESFTSRYPYYGASYSFSSSIDEEVQSRFRAESDSTNKYTGKALSYLETANQLYYLNKIQTPSHTGVFCRDLRYDEQSMISNFDKYNYRETTNLSEITDTIDYWSGTGSFYKSLPASPYSHYLSINPQDGVDSLRLYIYRTDWSGTANFIVFDGDAATGDTLMNWYPGCSCATEDTLITTGNEITIQVFIDSTGAKLGYDIEWYSYWDNSTAAWPNGRTEAIPQLKLSQVLLFDNDDLTSLPAISAIDTIANDVWWDYDDVNRSNCYNGDWYSTNQSTIDSLALQSVVLEQDYSLAKGYHNNRFVFIDTQSKTSTPVEVENNKYIDTNNTASSGKLTLNKLIYYGLNRTQTQPSHLFDYYASDTTDNPNYNHLLQDYWGNYKSDGEGNLLRGYVTDSSASTTDAWSLKKITTPLGGTTEIIYESDEYEQVLSSEKGGEMHGPIKTFVLKDVASDPDSTGADWTFELANQETEFWNLLDSLPEGASKYTVIPGVWTDEDASVYYYCNAFPYDDLSSYGGMISFGEGTFTDSSPNLIEDLTYYEINNDTFPTPMTACNSCSDQDSLHYSGGGFVAFEYPIGHKVKGGGTRVKELKQSNGTDTYVVSYTYDEGTATAEAGDYGKRKRKMDLYALYDWGVVSPDYNPFGMGPQVGYGKVTTENKGQGSSGPGTLIFTYHVSDEEYNYFEPYTARTDTNWNTGFPEFIQNDIKKAAIEVIDDFTTLWGKIKEQRVLDVEDVMISRKVYDYEKSTKGAQVSTLDYKVRDGDPDEVFHVVCIRRSYPNHLKKVTTYSNGRKSISEIVDRDSFTGEPIETKITSINGTETWGETVMAYTLSSTPDYSAMGAKSDDITNANILSAAYSSKTYKLSEGLSTADFSSYGKSFWKDSIKTRYYKAADDEYTTQISTVNWFDYTKYTWAGDLGDYGLFDSTAFTDINTPPTGTSDWRYLSEITLMDEEENVLEQKGYNNRFSASKLGYDNRFTYTSASNSNYVSFTACGFETETEVEAGTDYYEGEVLKQSGNTQQTVDGNVYPHTGNYMVEIASGNTAGPIYKVNYEATDSLYSLQRGRTYSASVWIHKDSPGATTLNIVLEGDTGATSYSTSDTMSIDNADAIQIGDWIQVNVNLEVPDNFTGETSGDGLSVYVDKPSSGDAWIDDMMFHSRVTGSGMNVYDQRTGRVLATLSDNNFATKYVYNDAGQVIEVWKEVLGDTWGRWVKVETRDFNFKRDME